MIANPNPQTRLKAGSRLIVIGSEEAEERFLKQLYD